MEYYLAYEIAAAVVVVAGVVIRQLLARPLGRWPFVGAFLTVIGGMAIAAVTTSRIVDSADLSLMAISWTMGIALAVARASLVNLWIDGRRAMRQGGVLTTALWVVATAQHLAIDATLPAGVGVATIAFFFGSSLVTQSVVMSARARRLVAGRRSARAAN